MNNLIKTISLLTLSCSVLFTACKKDDNPSSGSVELHFDNKVGGDALEMNTKWYLNANNDSFRVSRMNYYISNIRLNSSTPYTEPESYHLVQESEVASRSFTLEHIPAGSYTSITFTIGVDSLRNVSGAQTGALDPANGMFWSWNTGYIMAKFEGNSPNSTATGNQLIYHMGGFSGTNNVLKTVTLTLPQPVNPGNSNFRIHINADLLKWFGPNIIDFGTLNTIHMPGPDAKKISDNYANMFTVGEIETF